MSDIADDQTRHLQDRLARAERERDDALAELAKRAASGLGPLEERIAGELSALEARLIRRISAQILTTVALSVTVPALVVVVGLGLHRIVGGG